MCRRMNRRRVLPGHAGGVVDTENGFPTNECGEPYVLVNLFAVDSGGFSVVQVLLEPRRAIDCERRAEATNISRPLPAITAAGRLHGFVALEQSDCELAHDLNLADPDGTGLADGVLDLSAVDPGILCLAKMMAGSRPAHGGDGDFEHYQLFSLIRHRHDWLSF